MDALKSIDFLVCLSNSIFLLVQKLDILLLKLSKLIKLSSVTVPTSHIYQQCMAIRWWLVLYSSASQTI